MKNMTEEKEKELKEIDILKAIAIELRAIRQEFQKANQHLTMVESYTGTIT
jgi:uncharacterized protein (UPF0216 family)